MLRGPHVSGRVRLSATPWTVARQAPLCMALSRQECWSGHFQLQGTFPTQGLSPRLLCLLRWRLQGTELTVLYPEPRSCVKGPRQLAAAFLSSAATAPGHSTSRPVGTVPCAQASPRPLLLGPGEPPNSGHPGKPVSILPPCSTARWAGYKAVDFKELPPWVLQLYVCCGF